MTTKEFSQSFDAQIQAFIDFPTEGISYNNLEFDEYEKSIFLTRAQDEIIVSYYNGKNGYGDSFESTEEIRRYLSTLVDTVKLEEIKDCPYNDKVLSEDSHIFKLKDNTMFITYEAVKLGPSDNKCLNGAELEITPVTQDDFHRIRKNPFRGANDRRALRLDIGNNMVEIVCKYPIDYYLVRYLREPSPIIVDNLSPDTDIKGSHNISECEVHPTLHRTILDRAVQMAIASRSFKFNKS